MRPVLVASFFAAAFIGTAVSAVAEPLRPVVAGLPPYEIVAILRAAGFEPVVRPVRGAGVFFVRALAPDDEDVRVTVEARTGRILEVHPMGYARAPFPGGYRLASPRVYYDRSAGFEDMTGALPVPPRGVPGGATHLNARKAATPPLPRPRPGEAVAAAPVAQPAETVAPPAPTPEPAKATTPAPGPIEFPPVTPLE
ncbi:hypothetical protein RA307_22620 [Xanthobacteraceae bacterium Astr-EGSB]|uniref:hypothetical protein n=1 Tax=Astrobacterium formosum TaxID=3069710 RepID=UPI0027B6B337|nr:hypothetical protein [Xanthobacteraceae bacterium Astr-EGSB]